MYTVGSHNVLAKLPIWVITLIFASILTTVLIGRDITEGLMYNIAYSSTVGDVGLLIVVLIGATILRRKNVSIPWWIEAKKMHVAIFSASVLLGVITCILTLRSRSGQIMDIYHDIIIVPLFLYLAITILPVIFKNGKKTEVITTICLILLWASLVVFDVSQNRINQREWLQHHGVTLIK